jgi:hypothetical protein
MNETPSATSGESARRAEFRRLMMATVESSALQPKPRRAVAVTVATAVFLAGALTGGALVSTNSNHRAPTPAWWESSSARQAVLQGISGGTLVGDAHLALGRGSAHVGLGAMPANANALAISLPCLAPGTGTISVDGKKLSPSDYGCAKSSGSVSGLYPVTWTGRHHLTVTGSKGRPYAVLWSWTQSPEPAELFKLEQQFNETQQAYEHGVAQCGAGVLSGIPCSTGTPTPAP